MKTTVIGLTLFLFVYAFVPGAIAKPSTLTSQDDEEKLEELFARSPTDEKFNELSGNFLNGPVKVHKFVKGSPVGSKPIEKKEIERMWNKAKELPNSLGSLAERFERLVKKREEELKKDQDVLDLLKKRIVDQQVPPGPLSESKENVPKPSEEETRSAKRFVQVLSKRLADDFNKYFEEEVAKEKAKRTSAGGPFVVLGKRSKEALESRSQGEKPFVYLGDGTGSHENNEGKPEAQKPVDEKQRLEALRGLVAKYEDYLKSRHSSDKGDKYSKELESTNGMANSVEHEPFEVPYAKHGKGGFLDKTIEDISKRLKQLEKSSGVESPQKVSKQTEEILSGFGK